MTRDSECGNWGSSLPTFFAFLKSWDVLFPDPGEAERASLFETTTNEIHADKLKGIREILDLIKRVEVIQP